MLVLAMNYSVQLGMQIKVSSDQGCRSRGDRGAGVSTSILPHQLVLLQAGGGQQIMPTILLRTPLDFQTSLRPCTVGTTSTFAKR